MYSLNGEVSGYKCLQSHLSKILFLFNVYTFDTVNTVSRKLIYADDIALVAQARNLTTVEDILNQDLINLEHYFTKWYLTLNSNKTNRRSLT